MSIIRRVPWTIKPPAGLARLRQGHPLNRGLVGWWLMNEGGGLKLYDLSGKGNHGTLTNGPTWTSGKRGTALSFDGADDYVNAGDVSAIDGVAAEAIAFWGKRRAANTHLPVGKRQDSSNLNAIQLWNDGVIYFSVNDAGNGGYGSTANFNDTAWHHFVMVFDGSLSGNNRVKAYVDATAISLSYSTTGTGFPASIPDIGNFEIGANTSASAYGNGNIDDVRIYNRALSAGEIQSLYSDPLAALEPSPIIIWAPSAGVTSYTLTCTPGSFALTGAAATLKFNRLLSAASGAFALTGTATSLQFNRLLSAASGAFALTGTAATLTYNPVGSSTLTAASGSFSLAGTATTLKANRILTAASGSFALTGTAASIRANHVLAANSGSIVLTGTAATLTWSGAGSTTLTAADLAAIDALITAQLPNIAAAVLAAYVEGTTTVQQALRLYDAVLGGKVSGAGTNTETFRDLADTKDRIVATVDPSGNRTAVTRDLS